MVFFGASKNGNIAVKSSVLTARNSSPYRAFRYKIDADMQRGASRRDGVQKKHRGGAGGASAWQFDVADGPADYDFVVHAAHVERLALGVPAQKQLL